MRPFTVLEFEQRTPEWHAARAGRATGSRAADILAKIKTGEAAARRDYRMQLVAEILTGMPQEDGYINAAMQRGIDKEPDARAAYEALTGHLVTSTGFLAHTSLRAGCSLDGHLGDFETLVSFKCPKSSTHIRYLRGGKFPAEHRAQMLHELWITGAQAYDFLSFDDRFPEALQVFYVRVPRDETDVAEYAREARAFLTEVNQEVAALLTMTNLRGTLAAVLA
jgi:hypothetical protein